MMFDAITFISLGPGEPELITLKALKALQQADIIFCPSTKSVDENISSRALDILLELGIDRKKVSLFNVPMLKDRTKALKSYSEISIIIAETYKQGNKVAVVAEGDSGFYSSTHYISDHLSLSDIPTKQIAGIPAFIACGALANLHIVKQEEQLVVIPGKTTYDSLKEKIDLGQSVVIMKPSLCENITKDMLTEKNMYFHYFENVGVSGKEYYTSNKEEIRSRKFPYFSLLIIRQ